MDKETLRQLLAALKMQEVAISAITRPNMLWALRPPEDKRRRTMDSLLHEVSV